MQTSLKLNLDTPQGWQIFTFAYTHEGLSHFLGNIGLYLVLLFVLIWLLLHIKQVTAINKLLIFTLIFFPVIASALDILMFHRFFPDIKTTCGTSGLVAAVIGFLPFVWIKYLNKSYEISFYLAYFFGAYIVLLLILVYTPYKALLLVTILIFLLILLFKIHKDLWDLIKLQGQLLRANRVYGFIGIIAILFFIVLPIILFPIDLLKGGTFVNFFAHYIGIIYGIIAAYLYFKYKKL